MMNYWAIATFVLFALLCLAAYLIGCFAYALRLNQKRLEAVRAKLQVWHSKHIAEPFQTFEEGEEPKAMDAFLSRFIEGDSIQRARLVQDNALLRTSITNLETQIRNASSLLMSADPELGMSGEMLSLSAQEIFEALLENCVIRLRNCPKACVYMTNGNGSKISLREMVYAYARELRRLNGGRNQEHVGLRR